MASIDRRSALKMLALGALAPSALLAACSNSSAEPQQADSNPAPAPSPEPVAYTIDNIRNYVVGVDEPITLEDGTQQPAIAFDNAATTPAFLPVLQEVERCLPLYGSIGRGFSQKSDYSTDLYNTTRKKVLEFLGADLPDALAATDLVLSRAGSNALMEFQALDKPMLLIPYPKGASRGDQILNAQSFERRGLCKVLLQENMTADSLVKALRETWAARDALKAAVKAAPPANATARIMELIHEIQK